MTRLLEYIKKPQLKSTLKDIKKIINNQNCLVLDPENGQSVTQNMDDYKSKIQSDGILDKLKLIIVVIGDLQNRLETLGHKQLP